MFTELPKIQMNFNENKIIFEEIRDYNGKMDRPLTGTMIPKYWELRKNGDESLSAVAIRETGKDKLFSYKLIYNHKVLNTITAKDCSILFDEKRHLNNSENIKAGSFPSDYNFLDVKPHYLIGMSVPPIMTAQIASNIHEQWLSKL